MKVNLGTIEVNDHLRAAIRLRAGYTGLATRKEVRKLVHDLLNGDLEIISLEYCASCEDPECGSDHEFHSTGTAFSGTWTRT